MLLHHSRVRRPDVPDKDWHLQCPFRSPVIYMPSFFPSIRYRVLPDLGKRQHLYLLFQSFAVLYAIAHRSRNVASRVYLRSYKKNVRGPIPVRLHAAHL